MSERQTRCSGPVRERQAANRRPGRGLPKVGGSLRLTSARRRTTDEREGAAQISKARGSKNESVSSPRRCEVRGKPTGFHLGEATRQSRATSSARAGLLRRKNASQ